MRSARAATRSDRLNLFVVWVASAVYLRAYLNRGWYPHDDGSLAQSAERVLNGELPHRDFAEIYTGGLTYLHALSFRLFGTELSSMRLMLFAAFLAWIPALFAIARRFVSPLAASAVVALAVVWSVPNYPAPMPSWYNLFFATFAALALLRYGDDRRKRWVFLAGLACGGSAIVKLPPGAFTLIGVLLALIFLEQARDFESGGRKVHRSRYLVVVTGFAAAVTASLLALVWRRAGAAEIVDFVLPTAAIGALLVWNELQVRRGFLYARARHAAATAGVAVLGAALPVGAFLAPYVASGAVDSLVEGALLKPADRLEFAALRPLPLEDAWAGVGALALLVALSAVRARRARWFGPTELAWLLLLLVVLAAGFGGGIAGAAWFLARWGARLLIPVAVVLLMLEAARRSTALSRRDGPTVVFLAIASTGALVQFPYAAPIYFAYVAPLFFLAALALGHRLPELRARLFPRIFLVPLTAFMIAAAALHLNPGFFEINNAQEPLRVPLGLARANETFVRAEDRRVYRRIARLVEEHGAGKYIYAAPDAPEVYFLNNRRNPTPFLFDFLETPAERDRAVRTALDRRGISLVVINGNPTQSPLLTAALARELERRFPHSERVGHFDVRWRT